jgi:hypothetical protein
VTGTRRQRVAAAVVGCALLLAACGDAAEPDAGATPTAQVEADCRAAVDTLLATTQRYLDSIGGTTATGGTEPPAPADDAAEAEEEFTSALSNVRSYAGSLGCDPERFRDDLAAGLQQLTAGGPVANAVLLQLQADAAGTPQPATVAPGADLAAAVAAAPPDGVVSLEPGEHVLEETLVLLRGVTLRGAGRDATTVRSAAAGGVLLVLTGEAVALEELTLARSGDQPGPVLSAAPAATLALTGARVTGARADAEGVGGIGVLMAAGAAGQVGPTRRTSLRFTDSEAVDNAVAGVVVAGEHRAEVAGAVLDRSGQCGICFIDTSDGTVADSRFTGNAAGLVVAGQARPAVTGGTVSGGEVGIQVLDRAAPQVDGVTVSGSARAAFLFADASTGTVRGSTCTDVPFGIVVGPQAAPEIGENTGCPLARGE